LGSVERLHAVQGNPPRLEGQKHDVSTSNIIKDVGIYCQGKKNTKFFLICHFTGSSHDHGNKLRYNDNTTIFGWFLLKNSRTVLGCKDYNALTRRRTPTKYVIALFFEFSKSR
jgi:hypothetical protein